MVNLKMVDIWYRSRHYDAKRGRFGQADKWQSSVMNPVGYHPFTYVNGNPVLYVDPFGMEKIIFNMGASAENVSIHKKDLSDYKVVEVKSQTEMWNYMLYQKKENTGDLTSRSEDLISDIVFLGHGDDRVPKMRGNFDLLITDWQVFKKDNSTNYDKIFKSNLFIDVRVCDLGNTNYIDEMANNLPSGTKVKGYTTSVVTNKEGTDWGVLWTIFPSGKISLLNKTLIDWLYTRTAENCDSTKK
jgi:RHS repeat-associated protein